MDTLNQLINQLNKDYKDKQFRYSMEYDKQGNLSKYCLMIYENLNLQSVDYCRNEEELLTLLKERYVRK